MDDLDPGTFSPAAQWAICSPKYNLVSENKSRELTDISVRRSSKSEWALNPADTHTLNVSTDTWFVSTWGQSAPLAAQPVTFVQWQVENVCLWAVSMGKAVVMPSGLCHFCKLTRGLLLLPSEIWMTACDLSVPKKVIRTWLSLSPYDFTEIPTASLDFHCWHKKIYYKCCGLHNTHVHCVTVE